jgi:hypothetical protein
MFMTQFLKSFLYVSLIFIGCFLPVHAEASEYIYPDNLVVEGDRAFLMRLTQDGTSLSVYTFPTLTLIKSIALAEGTNWATLNKEGIVTYSSSYKDSQKDELENGKKRVYWVTSITNHLNTYDMNLNFISNLDLVSEYKYEVYEYESDYLSVPLMNESKNSKNTKNTKKQKYKKLSSGRLLLVK